MVRRPAGRGVRRWEVEVGSNPAAAGVTRALRFWLMESSIALRDNLRKSIRCM